ncbi:MAG: hypothetical protein A2583_13855 [Bdellovibrionales bacterium RIFOXYD1_FULL_53_11]|nr:MAG: hypothetical protein A2583_13855 [Bdellovibrionales bacterium RIFOXYD1_FULL_53_11]
MHEPVIERIGGDKSSPYALLCLHGGPGMDGSYFMSYLNDLKYECQHELVFYRQHQNGETTMPGLVDELHSVISKLKGIRVVLLGHSFGSALALEYIKKHGEKSPLAGLVLVSWLYDNHFFDAAKQRHEELYNEIAEQTKDITKQFKKRADDHLLRLITTANTPAYFGVLKEVEGRNVLGKIQYNARAYKDLLQNYLKDFDLKGVLKSLTLPTLSITGRSDCIIDCEYVKKGADLNPKIKHEVLPGGHFPFIESSRDFINNMSIFLKEEIIK